MPDAGISVDGLRLFARYAKATGEAEVLGALRDTFDRAQREALARMRSRAAATGRKQDAVASAILQGSRMQARAVIRSRPKLIYTRQNGTTTDVGQWIGGAAWGAHHDLARSTERGPRAGFNQFDLPRGPRSWFYRGGMDAAEEMAPEIIATLERLLSRLT